MRVEAGEVTELRVDYTSVQVAELPRRVVEYVAAEWSCTP